MQSIRNFRGGGDYIAISKAFTLVELIVVITILAILGTIAFISLNNFSASARDAKRLTDIRSLYTKLKLENTKGVKYSSMIDEKETYTLTINGEEKLVTKGVVDFESLKERRENFLDPITELDYLVAYYEDGIQEIASTITLTINMSLIELATISEEYNRNVIVGDYFPVLEDDTPGLIKGDDGEIIVNEGEGNAGGYTPPIMPSCDMDTKPIDNGNIIYTENPTTENEVWIQDSEAGCSYICKEGYGGIDCAVLPQGVQTLEPTGISCPNGEPDIIAIIGGVKMRIAGCNAWDGAFSATYSDINGTHHYYKFANATAWCQSKGTGRRLPTAAEYINMISTFGWTALSNTTGSIPYTAIQTDKPFNFYPAGWIDTNGSRFGIEAGIYWASNSSLCNGCLAFNLTDIYTVSTAGVGGRAAMLRCVKVY